jgi:hypothetical protein
MIEHRWPAIPTLLPTTVYSWMGLQVWFQHGKSCIDPPTMTGDSLLERAV